eukprot:5065584-Alexandrium_andersonii.AAC.1
MQPMLRSRSGHSRARAACARGRSCARAGMESLQPQTPFFSSNPKGGENMPPRGNKLKGSQPSGAMVAPPKVKATALAPRPPV